MRRAVLLDAMGTLVSLEPPAPRLRVALRERLGVEVSEAEALRALGAEIAYYRAHHLEGGDPAGLADLRGRCAAVLAAELPALRGAEPGRVLEALLGALRFRAEPGAAEALAALRAAGVRTVAVSNWDSSLPEALAQAGLLGLLDGTVSSAALGVAKPDPAPFLRGLELAGVEAGEALHVGDRVDEDLAGARAAGVEAALYAPDGAAAPDGVRVLRSLAELPGAAGIAS